MKVLLVIPARLESQRIKRKHLLEFVNGKTLFQMTYEACVKSSADKVIIATDDDLILQRGKQFTQDIEMTSTRHHNGTSRSAEIAARYPDYEIVVNVQGDEPLIDYNTINILIEDIKKDKGVKNMYTCITHFSNRQEVESPNNVKVVYDKDYKALYFSRSVIPYSRDDTFHLHDYRKHVGLYAFRREYLVKYIDDETSQYEQIEKLEYLRILEQGGDIQLVEVPQSGISVNVSEDIEILNTILNKRI